MKNKYLKGAHLSERKFREILKLFSEDLTATQIANISDISRVTVNNYLKLIRTHIAKFCEEKNPRYVKQGYMPYIPINGFSMGLENEDGINRKSLFGLYKKDDLVFADVMLHTDHKELIDWAKGKLSADKTASFAEMYGQYYAIADFNNYRLYRIIHSDRTELIKGKTYLDEIDFFWGSLKARIAKFRGLSGHTLFLHVKETEFRYNNRNADLFELLNHIILRRPLHYSKAI
jgi:transposase